LRDNFVLWLFHSHRLAAAHLKALFRIKIIEMHRYQYTILLELTNKGFFALLYVRAEGGGGRPEKSQSPLIPTIDIEFFGIFWNFLEFEKIVGFWAFNVVALTLNELL
jgi:hypothetical protein